LLFGRTIHKGFYGTLKFAQSFLRKRLGLRPLWTIQPESLQLDTTNKKCSLNCVYCNPQANFIKYGTGELPLSTIESLVDTLCQGKVQINATYPFMNSDPLLETRLPTIVKMLKKKLHCSILIRTNGVLYKRRQLLRNRGINHVCFTISAVDSSTYERVHGKPLFQKALKTLRWITKHKFWNQRIQLRYILFKGNVHNLVKWQKLFKGYIQEIRPLHWGESRDKSVELQDDENPVLSKYREMQLQKFGRLRVPCNCFHNLAISFDGKFMQCPDLPYEYNWGHVEEIDVMETWRKRLDLGLNHKGCRGCIQVNSDWEQLFEKYVW